MDSLLNAIKLKPNSNNKINFEEENGDLFASIPVSKKIIYWKVPENGYSYCSMNCLFSENLTSTNDFTNEKSNELINELKLRKVDEILPSLNPIQNDSINSDTVTNDEEKLENITQADELSNPETKIDFLECMPYANNTQYDSLKSILKRSKLKSKPEPELITLFDRTGRIEISELKLKLIEMKQQVSRFYIETLHLNLILKHKRYFNLKVFFLLKYESFIKLWQQIYWTIK